MIDVNHLCPGCMGFWENTEQPCPRCGFSWSGQPAPGRELPLFTILSGRYLLGRKLGSGGFGITYLAMDLLEERPVAIKEFFPVGLSGREGKQICPLPGEEGRAFREALRAFRRESQLMARFRNARGIVSWQGFAEENGTAYLIMDYVPGETLMQHLRRTGTVFSQQESLDLMAPILRAVDGMHRRHVLHRDISPENLILKPDGTLTLIDFGAAREFDLEGEENLTVVLKHGYAPEEQYRSGSHQGPWTDLYACCAVLYQMVSGIRPQDADQRREKDRLVPLDEIEGVTVTHGFARAVEKGLTVHATERYPSIQALLEDLMPSTPEAPAPKPEAQPAEDVPAAEASPEPENPPLKDIASHSSAPVPSALPSKKTLPMWAIATAAVLVLGLVIFLGSSLKFGGTDSAAPDKLPDLYGNLQEDGTTWVECESQEYQGEADLSTGQIQWKGQRQIATDWTFAEDEVQNAITYSTEEYPDGVEQNFYTYDTQGKLLCAIFSDFQIDYQYDYDENTSVFTTYNKDSIPIKIITTQYDDSGQYSSGHILNYVEDEYDPETGAVCSTQTATFSYDSDGSYQIEGNGSASDGSDSTYLHSSYRADGQLLESSETYLADYGYQNQTSTTCIYDDDGNCTSKIVERIDEMDGQQTLSRTEESISYRLDEEEGRLLEKTVIQTQSQNEEAPTTQIIHTLYHYDEWGNLLAEMEYAEGETEVWLTSYTYAQYVRKGDYVFEATGTVSGSSEPLWSELPQDALDAAGSGPSEAGTDVRSVLEAYGWVGESLEYPQYYDVDSAMTALDAGLIDCVMDAEIHSLSNAQSAGHFVIPPPSLDGVREGDGFYAIMTADMKLCWEITMALLDEGYYPEEGFWYGFFSSLRDNGGSTMAYLASDSLHEQLMKPYLDYWSQQTGGTYSLTMADA